MKEMPQRLRSYAPPTRDKIVIWCAVAAGCAVMALLLRQVALSKFGFDTFAANVSFCIALLLLGGLYLCFQSFIDTLNERRKEVISNNDFQVAMAHVDCGFDQSAHNTNVSESYVTTSEETKTPIEKKVIMPPYQILDEDEGMRHILFEDGTEVYVGLACTNQEILNEKAYQEYQNERLIEELNKAEIMDRYSCYRSNNGSPSFEEYMSGKSFDEINESFDEWLSLQPKDVQNDIRSGCEHVNVIPDYGVPLGCLSSCEFENRIEKEDGHIIVEHEKHEIYINAEGTPFFLPEIEEALKLYEDHGLNGKGSELLTQHEKCEAARKELEEEVRQEVMEKIEFVCAYMIYMMEAHLDATELQKLLHNAKMWSSKPLPTFMPVDINSRHLTKEDLKHLGYNVGKFFRLQGAEIARFVKKVFEKPFENTHIRTIEQKLRESKTTKERIPIHTSDQMERLFTHFQRYGNINPGILNKK